MFKSVIAPVQAWLMSMGQCVGCGAQLSKGKKEVRDEHTDKITCKCGRIFIYDKKTSKYRRALFSEV